jgi:type III secretion protein T
MRLMNDSLSSFLSVAELLPVLKNIALLVLACTVRIYAAFMILPPTSGQIFPVIARNGVCLCLGLYIAWGQPISMVSELSAARLVLMLGKELLLGLLIGFAGAVVFWVAEAVGTLIDNQAGYNNVQQTNPLSQEQSTPVGNLLGQLAIGGFYLLGGMTVLAGILFESYRWWPLVSMGPAWPNILESFVQIHTSRLLETAVKVAAPVLLALLIVELGIGLLNKSSPQIEATALALPIKAVVALAMLSLLVALFFDQARPALSLQLLAQELSQWAQVMRR